MTEAAAEPVWNGAEGLRPFLVAIDDLEPFPGNPRRGDVAVVRASLRRFGQVRPLLVDGRRIVAGHHVRLAAREEGWSHVAAVANRFGTEEEARAYLLADNRTAELGGYEDELLVAQLREIDDLVGTGWTDEDRDRLDRELEAAFAPAHDSPRLDERNPDPEAGFQVPIYLSREERLDFVRWVKTLEREWGLRGTTPTVVRAVREAALRANL